MPHMVLERLTLPTKLRRYFIGPYWCRSRQISKRFFVA